MGGVIGLEVAELFLGSSSQTSKFIYETILGCNFDQLFPFSMAVRPKRLGYKLTDHNF